jgi:micrococcal nuclease
MKYCFLFLFLTSALSADEFSARVVSVHDADTIVVLHDGRAETIRLKGINCPEADERNGLRAKRYATDAIQGKNVQLKTYGKDKYGRTIADIFLQGGKLFNKELVRTGNCRWGRSRAMRN